MNVLKIVGAWLVILAMIIEAPLSLAAAPGYSGSPAIAESQSLPEAVYQEEGVPSIDLEAYRQPLEAELSRLNEELSQLNEELSQLNEELDELYGELGQLNQELDQLNNERNQIAEASADRNVYELSVLQLHSNQFQLIQDVVALRAQDADEERDIAIAELEAELANIAYLIEAVGIAEERASMTEAYNTQLFDIDAAIADVSAAIANVQSKITIIHSAVAYVEASIAYIEAALYELSNFVPSSNDYNKEETPSSSEDVTDLVLPSVVKLKRIL